MKDEIGWLIEEDFGCGFHWIALSDDRWPRTEIKPFHERFEKREYITPIKRVKDASLALRFARKEDAEAMMKLFDRFLLSPYAAEHSWPETRP